MCLALIAVDTHPDYPLVMAANRDEFRARPTAPADFWPDHPNLLAGRDLQSGGTWLGITTTGRVALVTNVRDRRPAPPAAISRGQLVADFLIGSATAEAFLQGLDMARYAGFNLVCGTFKELWHGSNRGEGPLRVESGVHGLSNGVFDQPWPKVVTGRSRLRGVVDVDALLGVLSDTTQAADDALPDTGVGLELERYLSPVFIAGDAYGTRCSTVITVHHSGAVRFVEVSFEAKGPVNTVRKELSCVVS